VAGTAHAPGFLALPVLFPPGLKVEPEVLVVRRSKQWAPRSAQLAAWQLEVQWDVQHQRELRAAVLLEALAV